MEAENILEEYEVTLAINLAATSPEEAVNLFIQWIEEDGLRSWAYGVKNLETGAEHLYDTETGEMVF
jgi:hypothetical protein